MHRRVSRSRTVRSFIAGASSVALTGGLLVGITWTAVPAGADTTGYNNYVTLNPGGGNTATDGLRLVVSSGTYGIWRNGQDQVYGAGYASDLAVGQFPYNSIMLILDNGGDDTLVSFTRGRSGGPDSPAAWGGNDDFMTRMSWTSAETTITQSGTVNQPWIAETVLVADVNDDGANDDSLVVTTTYQVPDDTVALTYELHRTTSSRYRLYHGVDMYLDNNDFGPGTTSVVDGRRIVAQYNETGVGGFRQSNAAVDDTSWTSYMEGFYTCVFGSADETCPGSPYGPRNATRYPDTVNPNIVDAGVGIEFDLGTGAGVEIAASEFYFAKVPGTISGRFTDPSVAVDDTDTLVVTLESPSGTTTTGMGFTLDIPGGNRSPQRVYAGSPSTTCAGGSVTLNTATAPTDDSIVVSGVDLGGGESCTISIPISGFDSIPGVDYAITPVNVSGITGSPVPLININDQIVVEGKRYNDTAKTINDAGGTPGTGLKITYGAGQIQIVRDTGRQLYSPQYVPQQYIEPDLFNGYFLLVDDTLVGTKSGWPDDDSGWVAYNPGVNAIVNWDNVTASGGSSSGAGTITSTLTYNAPGGNTYTLQAELVYDPATGDDSSDRLTERLTLTVPADHSQDDTIKLYRGMDTYLNGDDFGSGFIDDSTIGAPRQVGALSADNAIRQYLEAIDDTSLWDGWYADTFACPVNPDYFDPLYGNCLTLDDSTPNSIVAGGNLWNDTTAVADDSTTDISLAVMWDTDDTTGTYTYSYDIVFETLAGAPQWVTTSLPGMTVGSPVDTTVVATPNAIPTTVYYQPAGGALPRGLELNRINGQITGTPTTPGPYSVTIRATNSKGAWTVRTFSGSVAAAPAPPTQPPSEPLNVIAVAGDEQVTVSWDPPSSPGSFPVTEYRVTASIGGATCVVPVSTRTCTLTGLTNGTTYTFSVEALNGAGWGNPGVSNEATPSGTRQPSIRIEGTYGDARVNVIGVTLELEPGVVVTPMVRLEGESSFRRGVGVRTLSSDGSFTWTRRVNGGKAVEVYFTGGGVESNRLTLTAPTVRSITLVGTRERDGRHDRIRAGGTTVGFATGTLLTPYIQYSGQSGFKEGKATIRVRADGDYTWTRQIAKARAVTAYIGADGVRSNRVTWDVIGR